MPRAVYLQAQRWGSAMPAPTGVGGRDANCKSAQTTVDVLGVDYETGESLPGRAGEVARWWPCGFLLAAAVLVRTPRVRMCVPRV